MGPLWGPYGGRGGLRPLRIKGLPCPQGRRRAGNIKIKEEIYTLMNNNLKRNLIYDKNNKLIDTSPLILNKGNIL
jgi:hypothetical protein